MSLFLVEKMKNCQKSDIIKIFLTFLLHYLKKKAEMKSGGNKKFKNYGNSAKNGNQQKNSEQKEEEKQIPKKTAHFAKATGATWGSLDLPVPEPEKHAQTPSNSFKPKRIEETNKFAPYVPKKEEPLPPAKPVQMSFTIQTNDDKPIEPNLFEPRTSFNSFAGEYKQGVIVPLSSRQIQYSDNYQPVQVTVYVPKSEVDTSFTQNFSGN